MNGMDMIIGKTDLILIIVRLNLHISATPSTM